MACFVYLLPVLKARHCLYEVLDSSGVPTREAKRRGQGWLEWPIWAGAIAWGGMKASLINSWVGPAWPLLTWWIGNMASFHTNRFSIFATFTNTNRV